MKEWRKDEIEEFSSPFNLETAVQGDKVMQSFKSESLVIVGDHSQMVKVPIITIDYGLKDCVNLSPSTAVSRFNLITSDFFETQRSQRKIGGSG